MSSDIAIKVEGLSKCYQIYDLPRDRLKQFMLPRLKRAIGQKPTNYYREFWALRDVSFEIKRGEVVGIIGRNGSGKSTLLQMICGTLNPTAGIIDANGRIAALLELGSGFNPEFTGRENVYMNAAVLGLSKEETDARFDEITAFADIGDFIDQPVKTYSSGMSVRLAFAVASCVEPDILVVDEALAVGDSVFQAKCFRRFQALREKGVTVLLVTHDIGAVMQLCSRAFVLHRGGLVASGSPKEMADEYRRRCAEEASSDRCLTIQANLPGQQEASASEPTRWMQRSPNTEEYGDGRAVFEGFALLDRNGEPQTKTTSGDELLLRMRLRFDEACAAPIVAFAFRDLAGQELCGTNTWFENNDIGFVERGEIVTIEYRFALPLQAGSYNLCIACTELGAEGLVAHHRLLDVATIEVAADRRFTGRFDLRPSVNFARQASVDGHAVLN